jgi:methionyl-tRNA formyltransferase
MVTEIENESKTNQEKVTTTMASLRQLIDDQEQVLLEQIRNVEINDKEPTQEYKRNLQVEQQGLVEQILNVMAVWKDKQPKKLLEAKQSFDKYIQKMDSRLLELKPLTRIKNHLTGIEEIKEIETQIRNMKLEKLPKHKNEQLQQRIANNPDRSKLNLFNLKLNDMDMEIVANEMAMNNVRK